jgi:hypothetical protein
MWTTKRNQFAFIGAAIAYVDSDWNHHLRHLAIKMMWRHKGDLLAQPIVALLKKNRWYKKLLAQTTDSGSNNNMMAKKMEEIFQFRGLLSSWDPGIMHVCCICHKFSLIGNAGLAALSMPNLKEFVRLVQHCLLEKKKYNATNKKLEIMKRILVFT